ncbi:MAG: arginine--tRNA ligase [Chloroflexi bacterium]|nr:arginine--tRNA ligase [Chloroflexota bacterium]
MTIQLKHRIAALVETAAAEAQRQGALPSGPLPDIEVERPQNPDHGDFSVSLPLKLARAARMNPMAIAQRLTPLLPSEEAIAGVQIAPPGFINFRVSQAWLQQQVESVISEGGRFGNLTLARPQRVQVEFVSVNPTGPVHVGHARGAVLGSGLASILAAAGHNVSREYYINDAGTQMQVFYRSLYARYLQALGREAAMPENGYMGEYMLDLGREVASEHGDRFARMPEAEAVAAIGKIGLEKMLALIRADLEAIGVTFDVWFSETTLYATGQYAETIEMLRQNGYVTQREGATWFTSTQLGEDKDNVLVRSTGDPTYFASDIAYHRNKFLARGFDRVINIWGADHQGHVSRLKAAAGALGVDPSRLTIVISQLVTLKQGDDVVRASKRKGNIVTLRELVEEVGADACRFFFLSRSPESQMEFDLELAKQQSSDNPVYYVQYAYARIASILRLAQEKGLDWSGGDVALLTDPAELDLVKKMLQLPELIETMAARLEPHHLPRYAMDLATAFHWFYQQCRVVSSEPSEKPITLARLKLVDASRVALARCLSLMGMSAPERM